MTPADDMSVSIRAILAAGLVVSSAVPAAQAQTLTNPPGTTRGLFGGDVQPNAARSTRQFTTWFDFGGGYDDNRETSDTPAGADLDGYASTVAGGFRYWQGRTTRSIESNGRLFRNAEGAAGTASVGGEVNLNGQVATGRRGGLTMAIRAANDSAQLFGAFGSDFASPGPAVDGEIPVSDVRPPTGIVEERWYSLGGAATAFRNWTPRQRTDVQYSQIARRPVEGDGLRSDVGQAGVWHNWNYSPDAGLVFTYRLDRVGQDLTVEAEAPPIQTHTVEAGFRYARRLSPVRTVQFTITGGSTYVQAIDAELAELPSTVEPTASAVASYTLTRRWSLIANASRRVTVLAGVALEPFVNDVASLSVTGLLARRTTIIVSGVVSRGEALGRAPGSFDATSTAVTLQQGFRYGGVFVAYGRYEHRLRDLLGSPGNIAEQFDRRSVRGGLTIWLPLYGAF